MIRERILSGAPSDGQEERSQAHAARPSGIDQEVAGDGRGIRATGRLHRASTTTVTAVARTLGRPSLGHQSRAPSDHSGSRGGWRREGCGSERAKRWGTWSTSNSLSVTTSKGSAWFTSVSARDGNRSKKCGAAIAKYREGQNTVRDRDLRLVEALPAPLAPPTFGA